MGVFYRWLRRLIMAHQQRKIFTFGRWSLYDTFFLLLLLLLWLLSLRFSLWDNIFIYLFRGTALLSRWLILSLSHIIILLLKFVLNFLNLVFIIIFTASIFCLLIFTFIANYKLFFLYLFTSTTSGPYIIWFIYFVLLFWPSRNDIYLRANVWTIVWFKISALIG